MLRINNRKYKWDNWLEGFRRKIIWTNTPKIIKWKINEHTIRKYVVFWNKWRKINKWDLKFISLKRKQLVPKYRKWINTW